MRVFEGNNISGIVNPAVTVGTFDGLHRGHTMLLSRLRESAAGLGGESVVVTFNPHPAIVLGKPGVNNRFLTSHEEKLYLLEKAGIDNTVVLKFDKALSSMTACDFVEHILCRKIGMKHLVVGFNHRFGSGGSGDYSVIRDCASRLDFTVEQLPGLTGNGDVLSSTAIRDALERGDLETANHMLGYDYFLTGTVVEGRKLGRSMGFPTANIMPAFSAKLLPADGVYVVRLMLGGREYGGMANIGRRPTVSSAGEPRSVEVHIFDFSGNIYGQQLMLSFLSRMRDELKYPSLDLLREQLERDRLWALNYLKGV